MLRLVLALVVVLVGCGAPDSAPPPREVSFEVEVTADGLSEAVAFEIPDNTRSLTVIAQGAPDALLALGELSVGDGLDLVQLPADPPGTAMQVSYEQEQIGQMPGRLFQSIRLGTFTHVYPYRPDQVVIPGTGALRIASNRPGLVRVTIQMPEDDDARVLPLNLYVVSATLAEPTTPEFIAELERVFAQAAIAVRIDVTERLVGTGLERITDFNEPQEGPTSQSAMLPELVADRASTALDVFFVEGLPSGVAGLSLGTPGPPERGRYYFGVIVRGDFPPIGLARVTAHEIAHFLALQHVQNRGVSGQWYPDPLDDTAPGAGNLMETGTVLTPDQAFALTRSALLVR